VIRVTESIGFFKPSWYSDWLLKVGKREANAISKKALAIGNRIDEIIRSGDYVADPKDTKEVKKSLQNFLSWRDRYNVKTLIPLERINDESIGLTGCGDFLWKETETLIDFKSSKKISAEYFFQLGGYKRLGYPCKKLAILCCDKEENYYDYKTNEDLGLSLETYVDAFESAFKHYRYYTHIEAKLQEMI
jgi:hypothetical protein